MAEQVIEVITGRARRRRWSVEEKLRIVGETFELGASVGQIAARHEVYPATGCGFPHRLDPGTAAKLGGKRQEGIVASFVGGKSRRVAWILRLVRIGTEGEGQTLDVMEIDRPDDLGDTVSVKQVAARES